MAKNDTEAPKKAAAKKTAAPEPTVIETEEAKKEVSNVVIRYLAWVMAKTASEQEMK